ncbi:hypothetical protein KP79_PYT05939 [Mizuhopecten yessoensis]|uniref:Uncharacterized protein n=1 Tax=Mizuhopecten yessoensis TaxID=6573 RepID=A0A210QA64_MIZYE|nr:hypothetical protein KP79_PYT05939 [Mizuhopecten yessoensis]
MDDLSHDIEVVKKWSAAKKLSAETAEAIITAGFTSMEALACLDPESIKKLKLNLGQTKLLEKAMRKTFLTEDERCNMDASQEHAHPDASGTGQDNVGHVIPEIVTTGNEVQEDEELVRTILNQLRQGQEPQAQ